MKIKELIFDVNEKSPINFVPYIEIGDIDIETKKYEIKNKGSVSNAILVKKGDILISTVRPTRGAITIVEQDFASASGAFAQLRANENICNSKYLFYALNRESFFQYLGTKSKGATYPTCSVKDIYNYEIIVPELSHQKKVVDELDKINIAIKNRSKTIKDYKFLLENILKEFILNYKVEDRKLKDYIHLQSGYAFKSEKLVNNGIPVVRIGNINSGKFISKDLKFYDEIDELKKYFLYPGDLVMTLTGTVGKDDYGNVCILDDSYSKYYLNQRNIKITCQNIEKYFLKYILAMPEVKRQIISSNRGVRQANISNKDIENTIIPIIKEEKQIEFSKYVEKVEKVIEILKVDIENLNKLMLYKLHDNFDIK